MGPKGMETTKWRGAVAALIALSTSSALGAQVAGAIRVRPAGSGDSTQMRVMMTMTKERMDSLAALMREFNVTAKGTVEWLQLQAKIDSLVPSRGTIFF